MIKLVVEPYCQNCKEFEPDFEKVCRNKGIPETIKECLCNANYDQGPNDDYDMDTMSDHYEIDIHIQ